MLPQRRQQLPPLSASPHTHTHMDAYTRMHVPASSSKQQSVNHTSARVQPQSHSISHSPIPQQQRRYMNNYNNSNNNNNDNNNDNNNNNNNNSHCHNETDDNEVVHWSTPDIIDKPNSICSRLIHVMRSLRLLVLVTVIGSFLACLLITWFLINNAATAAIDAVTDDYSQVLTTQVMSSFMQRIAMAEHIVQINRKHFRTGVFSLANKGGYLRVLFAQVTEFVVDTVSTVSLTTKDGQLIGYGHYLNVDGKGGRMLVRWDVDERDTMTAQEWLVDENGERTTNNWNISNTNNSLSTWYMCVNTSDPLSRGWTPLYPFSNSLFISHSAPIYTNNGILLGVTTIDMELGFTDTLAKQLARMSSVGTGFIIIEANSGYLIGSSFDVALLNNTDPAAVTGVFPSEASHYLIRDTDQILRQSLGRTHAHPSDAYRGVTAAFSLSSSVGAWIVNARALSHNSLSLVIVHLLDHAVITANIRESNQRVSIIVAVVSVACLVLLCLMLFVAMRSLRHLSQLIDSFANFEFRAHVAGGQLLSPSVFSEVHALQNSVVAMTKAFSAHIQKTKSLKAGATGGAGGGPGRSHLNAASQLT